MNAQVQKQREIFAMLEPIVRAEGYELVAIEMTQVGGMLTLRISADKEGGIAMEHLGPLTRVLSAVLDVEDPITGAYRLEVSSPGLERPLQIKSDFLRFKGFRARIRLEEGPPRRRYSGELLGVDGDTVSILVDGETHALDFEQIEKANLVLDLDEYQKLGTDPPPRVNPEQETENDQ